MGGPAPQRGNACCASWARSGRGGLLNLLAGHGVKGHFVFGLGGPPARWALDGGDASGPDYWLRVWALRGLLWLWDPVATSGVVKALADDAWRVREMAAKVTARHLLDEALPALLHLRDDSVARVRAAAARAVIRVTSAGRLVRLSDSGSAS